MNNHCRQLALLSLILPVSCATVPEPMPMTPTELCEKKCVEERDACRDANSVYYWNSCEFKLSDCLTACDEQVQ